MSNEKIMLTQWTYNEWQGSITIRDGKNMVCRCSLSAKGKRYAMLIQRMPKMCNLLNQLNQLGDGVEGIIRLSRIQYEARKILEVMEPVLHGEAK